MKSALVTGATDGIGRETARQLLKLGLHVLVHGRSESKATAAASALNAVSGSANVTPVWADFSRMREVVNMAEQVNALIPQLDILINNAGVYEKERRMSEDGFEMTMAVNHFASFLLTRRLLAAIVSAPRGRIVTVSSMTGPATPCRIPRMIDWSRLPMAARARLCCSDIRTSSFGG